MLQREAAAGAAPTTPPTRLAGRLELKLARAQWIARCVGGTAAAVLLTAVLAVLDHNRIADDAYMFVRYARNFIATGVVAWNPGGAATYGLTSLGYFVWVLLIHVLSRADAACVLLAASLSCGVAFVVASTLAAARLSGPSGGGAHMASGAVALVLLAAGATALVPHFVSGMD